MGTGLGQNFELKRQRLDNTSQRAVLAWESPWCRHEDGAACGDVGDDFFAVITGVDYARSFGIVGGHAADISAGAEADYAAET